ncbi:MAG: hypothetical protein ACTXOO_00855 [Sodalis sp. (in: enterobacteria)]
MIFPPPKSFDGDAQASYNAQSGNARNSSLTASITTTCSFFLPKGIG